MPRILSAFGKLGILALVAVVFAAGLLLSVYLSLRSPEITVPDVVNQSYLDGEATLGKAGLDIRERAARFKPGVAPGVILDQSPRAGEVIKAGQTVAVVVSRAPREGERPPDEEVAEERREEEKTGTRTENVNANANANRERRRAANRNANANAAANTNANASANTGVNLNRNAPPANRNGGDANTPVNRNANTRNANTRNANSGGSRNANAARPTATNANRRPNN
ncbi:MAG TPA: PASTA domain-containing protein [Pyrinomonadaceae bacterium]|nr:PASTA domain-containing protein [Pyrinomonadaceae bacterium]